MEKQLKALLKSLKINEGTISSIMGGLVILVMAVMIFNYFKSINKAGKVTNQAANNSSELSVEGENVQLPAVYTVKKGDDLWHISEKFYKSGYNYVDIISENKIKNPSVITAGTELKIPKVEARLTSKMKAELAAKESATSKQQISVKTAQITIEGASYTTVKGDHLWSIAVRAYGDGYAWTKIYNANKAKIGRNPSLIFSGVELALPR